MTCKVNEETVNVIWKKDGDPTIERAVIDRRLHKLAITKVVEKDSGEYSCEARNKPGTVARSVFTVIVKGKLFKEPHIISVINYVRSLLQNTPPLFKFLTNFSSGFLVFWELEI